MKSKMKGFAALASMLLVMALLLIMGAIFVASESLATNVTNANNAAVFIAQLNSANWQYSRLYSGVLVSQPWLAGNLNSPVSCSNSGLVAGQVANGMPPGYSLTMTMTSPSPSFVCPSGPTGYLQMTIVATPKYSTQRNFFSCTGPTSCDGAIHWAMGRPALESDPTINVSNGVVIGSVIGSSGGSSSAAGLGQWNSSSSYTVGAMVIRPAQFAGDQSSVGPFINLTGLNGDPALDAADWAVVGPTPALYTAPNQHSVLASVSLVIPFPVPSGGYSVSLAPNTFRGTSPQTFSSVGFTVSPPEGLGGSSEDLSLTDLSTGATAYCQTNVANTYGSSVTSCVASLAAPGNGLWGFSSGSSITINPGDLLAIKVSWVNDPKITTYFAQTINLSLNP